MAVDRLVLTDRFSDFIRNFTLRASATEFSLRDLDTAIRTFDRTGTARYGRELRRVLAGLERLFYVSPFEALSLVKAARLHKYADAKQLLESFAQEWLDRGAASMEILGAEPLAILVREHVLDGTAGRTGDPGAGLSERLRDSGIQFMATKTNLVQGRLGISHIPPVKKEEDGTRIIEALLASSAFPAVFRPRWSWEIDPDTNCVEQYIDGGVLDNLPLDAVASFLNDARVDDCIQPRPEVGGVNVPHLLFTGSLEVDRSTISNEQAKSIAGYWRRTRRRAAQLSYNNKIDNYARTQEALRSIRRAAAPDPLPYEPLDLEVVVAKPKWLCGTFAFHPMLGFKRLEQARSIAHGCKTTLSKLAELSRSQPRWVSAWGMREPRCWREEPQRANGAKGYCWYRTECLCPFSKQGLKASGASNKNTPQTQRALLKIYKECRKAKTHRPH